MDLSTIRARAQFLANDQNARTATAAQLTNLINDALSEWCSRTEEVVQDGYYTVTNKVFTIDAPADIIKIRKAAYLKGGYTPLEVVGDHEFEDQGGDVLDYSSGQARILKLEGKNADYNYRLFPAPSASSGATTVSDAGGISSSDTTIGVAALTNLRQPAGVVLIESEKVLYHSVNTSTPSLTDCVRGYGGTTAASHADSVALTQCDLFVQYVRYASTLSADGDIPEIASNYHKYLAYHAAATMLESDGRDPARLVQKWEQVIRLASNQIRRRWSGSPVQQIRTMY